MKKEQDKKSQDFDFESFEESAIAGLQSGRPLFGEGGILQELAKHLVEASIEGELDHHLEEQKAAYIANRRNGKGRKKKVRSSVGDIEIQTSRERRAIFLLRQWENGNGK